MKSQSHDILQGDGTMNTVTWRRVTSVSGHWMAGRHRSRRQGHNPSRAAAPNGHSSNPYLGVSTQFVHLYSPITTPRPQPVQGGCSKWPQFKPVPGSEYTILTFIFMYSERRDGTNYDPEATTRPGRLLQVATVQNPYLAVSTLFIHLFSPITTPRPQTRPGRLLQVATVQTRPGQWVHLYSPITTPRPQPVQGGCSKWPQFKPVPGSEYTIHTFIFMYSGIFCLTWFCNHNRRNKATFVCPLFCMSLCLLLTLKNHGLHVLLK